VIIDPEITIGPTRDGAGHHGLDLLRDDPDIRLVAAEIAEAVITETIVEVSELDDVMLQREIGTPSTTATTASKASASASAAATSTVESAAGGNRSAGNSGTCETCPAARGLEICSPARLHRESTVAPAAACSAGTAASVGGARLLACTPIAGASLFARTPVTRAAI
jgi:hypothetical protein